MAVLGIKFEPFIHLCLAYQLLALAADHILGDELLLFLLCAKAANVSRTRKKVNKNEFLTLIIIGEQ